MASVRETRKIAVEEAPAPALGVGGGLPVEEAIPLQASAVLPQIPHTVSDAALDDGHPKADTFFTLVREQVSPALRYNVPILFYAVAVAVPTLCVYIPLTREVIIPVNSGNGTLADGNGALAHGNGTLASMSSASAHGYIEASGLFIYFQFLVINEILLGFIEGHPTTKWYSVVLSVVNLLNTSFHIVVRHCAFYYSMDRGTWNMVGLGLSVIFFVIQLPLNFGIVHLFLQKNAPGSRCWHMPLCAFCFAMEVGNMVVIRGSTSYLHNSLFQWTAPFVFSLTAMFTRRAAEWSVVPLLAAPHLSTLSLGLAVFFTRLAQSAVLNDPQLFLTLELFYAFLSIFLHVSLYSRHAILSFALSGTCKVRGVPRHARAQGIMTGSLIIEMIFDTAGFIILFLSRFLLLPSSITTSVFILLLCVCIVIQILANTATFLLVSYFEEIPIEAFFISWTSLGDFWNRWIYLWACTMFGMMYLNNVTLNIWDPSMRTDVPWK